MLRSLLPMIAIGGPFATMWVCKYSSKLQIHLINSWQNDALPTTDVLFSRLHDKYLPSMQFGEANKK
jgi:hypothetical protein